MEITPNLILIYDIEHDGTRSKIADACLDYGLDRVQYSAFLGQLSRNHAEELMQEIHRILGDRRGVIQLIPFDSQSWGKRLEVCHE